MNSSLKDLKNKIDTLTASGAVNQEIKDKLDELARGIAAIQTLKINNVQKIAQNLKNEFTLSQH